jgi:3-oxoacyl-[acyl-carrier-protein] synthase II
MSKVSKAVVVRGIGWLDGEAWGRVLRHERVVCGESAGAVPPWKQKELFAYAIKNPGRFDAVSRMTLCACALALKDAGATYQEGVKQDIGLVGTNASGCMEANVAYFQDYLAAGRILARGNLFVRTLSSSPMAEAAIHFGLCGPTLYIGFPGGGLDDLLDAGAGLVEDGGVASVLAVRADEREAIAFLLGKADGPGGVSWRAMSEMLVGARGDTPVREWASRLEKVM